jgi:uncharacterized OB-fold protein
MNVDHPRPAAVGDAAEFWSWMRAGEFRLQHCDECGRFRHPPQPSCPSCGSHGRSWQSSDGLGEVWSTTTIHPPVLAAFADRVPYRAIVVRLDEGVFIVTNPVDDAELPIGTRVEVRLQPIDDDLVLPLAEASTSKK